MKATEERIGNYVYGINRRSEIHISNELPLKVLQIELFNTYVLPLDQNPATCVKWFKITNEDLSPIPLTEEWLKKFGLFIEGSGYNNFNNTEFCCYKLNSGRGYGLYFDDNFTGIVIKYVHQLQNLYLDLTEEELTTK